MPYSSMAGKAWIAARLGIVGSVTRVLDLGAGSGQYPRLFRERLGTAEWIGIEAWAPYVERFSLGELYDRLIIGDVREVDLEPLGCFDLCFAGDILEHMRSADARVLVDRLLARVKLVFASVPIGHYPQGAVNDNPFEVHVVDDYSDESFRALFPEAVDGWVETVDGWTIGAFALTTHEAVRASLLSLATESSSERR